jgi:hypothetical protein
VATLNVRNTGGLYPSHAGFVLTLDNIIDPTPFFASGIRCDSPDGSLAPYSCDTLSSALRAANREKGGIAVQLGTPFRLESRTLVESKGNRVDQYFGTAALDLTLRFAFFELDGTPVAITEAVPEPGETAAIGLAMLSGFEVLRRRRDKRPS